MASKLKMVAVRNMETATEPAVPVKVLGAAVLLDATKGLSMSVLHLIQCESQMLTIPLKCYWSIDIYLMLWHLAMFCLSLVKLLL